MTTASDVNPADPFSYFVTSRSYSCCNKQECRALCKDLYRGDSSGAREMVASCRDGCKEMEISSADAGGTCVGSVGSGCEDWCELEFGLDVEQCTVADCAGCSPCASTQADEPMPPPPEPMPPPPSPPPPSEGTGEVCCCVTSQPVDGLPMSSSKPVAKARRWLLANHLKLIRELDQFRNDRVVSGAQAQGICPTGYYQAVENPNHWACGAGCAGGMYTDVHCLCACQCLTGVPDLKESDGPCADSVDGAGGEAPLKDFVQKLEELGMERLTGTEREQIPRAPRPRRRRHRRRAPPRETLLLFRGHVVAVGTRHRRRPDARAVHAARAGLPRYRGDRRLVPLRGSK